MCDSLVVSGFYLLRILPISILGVNKAKSNISIVLGEILVISWEVTVHQPYCYVGEGLSYF